MRADRIRSAIESLVRCETCSHGIGSHDGSGCSDCSCGHTTQDVIEQALEAAREEIRQVWAGTGSTMTRSVDNE
jgi:hypothetical protein